MRKSICLLLSLLLTACLACAAADAGAFIANSGSASSACFGEYGMLLSDPVEVSANQRFSLRAGPATEYYDVGTFAYDDIRGERVFVQESDGNILWVLVDFQCSAGRICAYTGLKRVDAWEELPYGNKEGVACRIGSSDAYAYYGPGREYVQLRSKLRAGKRVTAYYEYNGYVMVEYTFSDDDTLYRAWVSRSALD